jgi:hypothetical protein
MARSPFSLLKALARRMLGRHDLWKVYLTKADLRPYLREYRVIAARRKSSPEVFADLWCNYMIALMECGELREFDKVYDEFIRRGGGAAQIKDFLFLSNIAVQKGMADAEVCRSAGMYTKLKASHDGHALESFVKGKTVAIVGSGPSERGKGLGGEIDSHDIVIRINNHTVKGFEADYGSRTDIWAKHTSDYLRHDLPDTGIKMVVYAANWMRDRLVYGYKDAIERDLSKRIVDYCDALDRAALTESINGHPMTGTLLIEKLRHSQMASLDAYGFSFLESGDSGYAHYFNDKDVSTPSTTVGIHRLSSETSYLKRMFGGGRRLYPSERKSGD